MTNTLKRTMPESASDDLAPTRLEILGYTGLALVLLPLLIRATTTLTNLPMWDLDPLSFALPMTGLGPGGSLVIDAIVLIGAAMLLWSSVARFGAGRGLASVWVMLALACLGAIAIIIHAERGTLGSLGDRRTGYAWLSGIFAGVALVHASRDARLRRIAASVLVGMLVVFVLKSAVQVFIEHPRTIASYKANPQQYLAAQGWAPGSSMAKAYERRLMQPTASGWFGLSNVLASFASAGAISAAAMLVLARGRASIAVLVTLGLVAGASAWMVVLTGAKGGMLAVAGGAVLLLAAWMFARQTERGPSGTSTAAWLRRLLLAAGALAIIGALALIVARGIIGERVGELSLLFRWFYFQAAGRMFAEHWLIGVGPDGFQTAYAIYKNPLSTEDVTSPHAMLMDYASMLGALGLGWVALVAIWARGASHGLVAAASSPRDLTNPPPLARTELRVAMGIAALATLGATYADAPLIVPETAMVRLLGLVLWCVVIWSVLHVFATSQRSLAALAIGAIVLLAHAQIDLTASWAQSCGLLIACIAVGVGMGRKHDENAPRTHAAIPPLAALVPLGLAIIVGLAARHALAWERTLLTAASHVTPIADFSLRWTELSSATPPANDSRERYFADLSALLGRPVPATPDGLRLAQADLDRRAIPRAVELLLRADALAPTDFRPRREASRLLMRLADGERSLGNVDRALALQHDAIKTFGVESESSSPHPHTHHSRSSLELRWAAVLYERRAGAESPATATATLRSAAALLERSLESDPYNIDTASKLVRIWQRINDAEQTRRWARRALELNDLQRLDQDIRGLTDADRTAFEALAKP